MSADNLIADVTNETSSFAGPGALLQATREKAGIKLEAVADRLKMAKKIVVALEADDYDNLPGETFVRGYIRAYARLMSKDPNELIQIYEDYIGRTDSSVSRVQAEAEAPVEKDRGLWFFVITLIIAAVFVLAVYFLAGSKPEVKSDAGLSSREPELVVETATEVHETLVVERLAENDMQIMEQPESAPTPIPVATATQVQHNPRKLLMTFSGDCWVEVTDDLGDVLLTNLQAAGDSVEVLGEPPFSLLLGDASVSQVIYMGELVELVPNPSNSSAKLTVGSRLQ